MVDALLLLASTAFIASLIPLRYNNIFAAVGWASIIGALYAELPYYFSVNNFIYPLFAFLSIPFLIITWRRLYHRDEPVMNLSRAAALACLIYAPFTFIPPLGDWLINVVVGQTRWMLDLFELPTTLTSWNIIARNGLRTEIILACTGIQSIAIMLGVIGGVASSLRQKVIGFFLIAPVIYGLNIVRNTFVIAAYTEQWFPYLPELASNGEYGYESFFWAHNVVSEILALFVLIGLAYQLFAIIPALGDWANDLYTVYHEDLSSGFKRIGLL